MASAAQLLFTAGTVVLVVAFAAHVGHAVLLANGRRLAAAAAVMGAGMSSTRPAWAGLASG